jgi:outer membrane protein assembly factor BamA
MKNIICFFIFFALTIKTVVGQSDDNSYSIPIKDTLTSTITPIYLKLIKKGYLIPTFKILTNEKGFALLITPNKKYAKVLLTTNNQNENTLSPSELGLKLESQFNELINNGFPFAKIIVSSIEFEDNQIKAVVHIEKGPFYQWDEILIDGDVKIKEQFLRAILDIKKESPYSEMTFLTINQKINQLPYLTTVQNPELLFKGDNKVTVYLHLQSRPINTISGTIGIQQNPKTQNYFLVGDLKMKLINQLKKGEGIDLQWRRIQESTQSLKIGANYPSLFKSNFGIDNQFNLYKKDSTFIEIKNQFGIQYLTTYGFLIRANYKYLESNTLNTNSSNSNLGKSINYFYGLSMSKQKLDNIPVPRKGFQFLLDVSLGKRNTSRSDSLKSKYDNTLKLEYSFSYYLPFFKRHILKTQFTGEIYQAPFYYQNELLRFGGLLNQRGFREDELLGNLRFTQSFEYRFMIEQFSYLFSYFDFSYYENHFKNTIYSTPFGFGTGLSFGTQQGIFSISYALGKQFNNPILLKNGIIHFGYISYF